MHLKTLAALLALLASDLTWLAPAGLAQQSRAGNSAGTPRRGYYSRVVTSAYSSRSGVDASNFGSGALQAYGGDSREAHPPRPYEQPPAITRPERETPAPATPHNYYPSLRAGQTANHNVVSRSHCVPGRQAFLHR